MTKEQARHFKGRWRLVDERIAEEIRRTPPEIKLRQMRTMFATHRLFQQSSKEEQDVRDRWRLLKQKANV